MQHKELLAMSPLSRTDRTHLAVLIAFWALAPALPALFSGGFIGQGSTDLYPSIWGLWSFAQAQPALPVWTDQIAAPTGIGFFYSSPLHGWAAWPLLPVLGITATWNILLIGSRIAGVWVAHWAARAWGFKPAGALMAAAIYGCAPFFHGYAVEGIVEGQTGWALALWLGWVGLGRTRLAAFAFGLTVISSWYMAASACLLAVLIPKKAWRSAGLGLLFALPVLWAFLHAFPERELLDPAVRRMMGSQIGTWTPGLAEGINPFAKTSWIGFGVFALCASQALRHPRVVVACFVFWILSMGLPLVYELPLFSALRFPYRLHAGTLVLLAFLGAKAVQDRKWAPMAVGWVVLEGLALSPIEPILPHAPSTQPTVYQNIQGQVLLDIPGPFARAPGLHNPSRPRARWFLYGQLEHGMASPWAPDFNSVGIEKTENTDIAALRVLDPHWPGGLSEGLSIPQFVDHVVLHTRLLGQNAEMAHSFLLKDGWSQSFSDTEGRRRYARSKP
jgi:hypothetical protein